MKVRVSEQELARFEYLVTNMTPRSQVYKMLKRVLSAQDHWKNRSRYKNTDLPIHLRRYEFDYKTIKKILDS